MVLTAMMLGQLMGQLPVILVSLAGLGLAAWLWRRATTAAALLLGSSLLQLLLTLSTLLLYGWYLPHMHIPGVFAQTRLLAVFALLQAVLHAIVHGLLIGAVLVGRPALRSVRTSLTPPPLI